MSQHGDEDRKINRAKEKLNRLHQFHCRTFPNTGIILPEPLLSPEMEKLNDVGGGRDFVVQASRRHELSKPPSQRPKLPTALRHLRKLVGGFEGSWDLVRDRGKGKDLVRDRRSSIALVNEIQSQLES